MRTGRSRSCMDGNLGQDSLQQVQVRTLPAVCVQVLNSKIEEKQSRTDAGLS